MSLKNLGLRREAIVSSVEMYCGLSGYGTYKVAKEIEELTGTRNRLSITIEDKDLYIDFHFVKGGLTTIDTSGGSHREIKDKIAKHISEDQNCLLTSDGKAKWFVIKNLDQGEFEVLLDLIKDSKLIKSTLKNGESGNVYQFTGPYDEKFTMTYYSSRTLLMQGKPLLLFSEAISYSVELLNDEKIFGAFNEFYNIDISKDSVDEKIKIALPDSHDKLPSKLKKSISQAVYNLQIDGDMYEYTFLVFPALRALEGHLKNVVLSNNLVLEGGRFNLFDKSSTGKYSLKNENITLVGCSKKCAYIEKAYQHISDRRNKYFHWEEDVVGLDTTALIENIGAAKIMITDAISMINEYYTL